MAATKQFTWEEIVKHNKANDCWIVIDGRVYDMTAFLNDHPGGKAVVVKVGGTDASKQFAMFHKPAETLRKYGPKLLIGSVAGGAAAAPKPTAAAAPKASTAPKTASTATATSSAPSKQPETKQSGGGHGSSTATAAAGSGSVTAAGLKVITYPKPFGDQIPFGDPYWYQGLASPYYTASHEAFRAKCRAFVDTELAPHCHEWDEAGTYPKELHKKAYEAGLYGAMWPAQFGGTPPQGCDAFHDLILIDELSRCASGGMLWSVFFTFGISLPPILNVGSQDMKDRIARDVISGKKIISLAVTEPQAGSDVAGLLSTAERDGDDFIVNGVKKFITSGTRADYFTTAVRTGGPGMGGVSLLLIEATRPGVKTTRMKTQGWWMSSTALVAFDNVRVPVSNVIGKLNDGFSSIMSNFNHERFVFAAMSNRYARVCIEESVKYARKRITFGKKMTEHAVIRAKIADMTRHVEATHALLEQLAFQMSQGINERKLAGPIALCKVQATKTMELCCREATQIFGGAACVRGGVGEKVERLYREVRVNAIAGGSEEILADLAMRQAKL